MSEQFRAVWRFPCADPGSTIVHDLPVGARFVHVGVMDRPVPIQMWFEVEPGAPMERRRFGLVPTGGRYHGAYLGTVVHDPSQTVWHLIEPPPQEEYR
jgi:hypothetical protein